MADEETQATVTLRSLADLPRWVAWQLETTEPNKPPAKVPYTPNSGRRASSTNAGEWGTRAAAEARAGRLAKPLNVGGVGLVLGDLGDGTAVCGVDLDSCVRDDGELEDWAYRWVYSLNSYAEVSPSGRGVKVFFTCKSEDVAQLSALMGGLLGRKWAAAGGGAHPPAVELYLGSRYFAVTDQRLEKSPPSLRRLSLEQLRRHVQEDWPREFAPAGAGGNGATSGRPADQSRSGVAFRRGCALVRGGADFEEMCAGLLADPETAEWTREKGEPRDRRELRKIYEKAREAADEPDKVVDELNRTYALVLLGGQSVVMKEGIDPEGEPNLSFLAEGSFKSWFRNRHVWMTTKTGKPVAVPLADHWLAHPRRRQYEGLVFLPKETVVGYYNLWRGFAVDPKPGDCSRFKTHLLENVCGGRQDLYDWVFGWWAAIFQHPERKTGTSLVIRGKEGTGKTIVGKIFGALLGSHYVSVSDPRYIVGRFNSHMTSAVVLHADEGFWAGDHASEGRLKDLITGDTHLIEFKGKEPVKVKNYVRLFVTGNPDWVVPVSLEGRRFAVFEIGDGHKQDGPYFQALEDQIYRDSGLEALLHDLLTFDLSGINLKAIPETAALLDQKVASLTPEQGWWMDTLQRGALPYGCDAPNECPTSRLFDKYIEHGQKVGVRRRAIETQLGTFLNRAVPGLGKFRGLYRDGEFVRDGNVYRFPELSGCRNAFAQMLHQDVSWGEPEEWLSTDGRRIEDVGGGSVGSPPERVVANLPDQDDDIPF